MVGISDLCIRLTVINGSQFFQTDSLESRRTIHFKTVKEGTPFHACVNSNCPKSIDGYLYAWHFVLNCDLSKFISISCKFKSAGDITVSIEDQQAKSIFAYTPTADTLISAFAEITDGTATEIILKGVCKQSA